MKVKKIKVFKLIILVLIIVLGILLVYRLINRKQPKAENNTPKIEESGPNNFSEKIDIANIDENNNKIVTDNDIAFALNFLKLNNKKSNVIYSPLSIKYALKMLNEGSAGQTKEQIDKIIGNTTLNRYNNQKDILSLANSLYIKNTYAPNLNEDYKNILQNNYQAEIKYDGFSSAKNINGWISEKTFNLIPNILKDADVTNRDSKFFLINALAIDMDWIISFDESRSDEFFIDDKHKMDTLMMFRTFWEDEAQYYVSDNESVLFMDLNKYNNTQLEFLAIMPNNNLEDYIKNFSPDTLTNITNNKKSSSLVKDGVIVNIPKFNYEYKLPLKKNLISMGIEDVFTPSADLSKIDSSGSLYVNDAIHTATIDFNEKGIKAAAATAFVMIATASADSEPIILVFNKPFMYIIRDKKTNEIWFVGKVYKPFDLKELIEKEEKANKRN